MSIRNLFKLELRRLAKRRRVPTTLGVLLLIFGSCDAQLFAQRSNVEKREGGRPSASSIFAGNKLAEGGTSGVDRSRSKFDDGAVYDAANGVVGIDGSSSSRFDSVSRFRSADSGAFQSSQDFSLLRKSAERRKAIVNSLASQAAGRDNSPRLVSASKSPQIPYATNRKARYGVGKDEIADKQRIQPSRTTPEESAAIQDEFFREEIAAQSMPTPRQIWMRGRRPNLGAVRPDAERWGAEPDVPYVDVGGAPYYDEPWQGSNGLGGDLGLNANLFETSLPMQAPIVQTPTPAETRQAFQGYLEAQLLRSPSVNPLSPIQVTFNDGVAVVRGVVPTPSARVAAGDILLADPRVQKVENKLTFVRPDDGELSPQVRPTPNQANGASN